MPARWPAHSFHDPHQGTLVDRVGNHLDGGDQVIEQGGKVAGGAGDVALLLDDELGERGAGVHGASSR
jgi:hypothetical protein